MIQAESSRLSAPWQSLFRLVWWAAALLVLGSLIVGSPARYAELHSLCPEASCQDFERLTQAGLSSLEGVGLSLGFYAAYLTGLTASGALVSLFIGALLAWRKPGYQAAAVFAVILPLLSMLSYPSNEQTALSWLVIIISILQAGSLLLFLLLFPDGHFTPGWTRWLIPAWAALNLTRAIPASPLNHIQLLDDLQWLTTIILAMGSQIYRYMRVSGPVQRQQTRWLVFVIFLALVVEIPLALAPPAKGSLLFLVERTVSYLFGIAIPLTVGIAILRYRLYDIDFIIRRTLQYSLLTGLLALGYFGSVVLLQSLFSAFGAQSSSVVIVLSTLGIAVLFNPLRKRIQDVIDRRFYRKKYDSEQALAEFAATARNETDLEALTTQMVNVVQNTMQPESQSLWIKESQK